MIIFKIKGENSAAALYTWELMLQCKVAEHSFRRLKEAARVQVERDFQAAKPRSMNVYEVFADCSAFLSAAGIVAKILYADSRLYRRKSGPRKRSQALREVLKICDLPILQGLGVRNSFEHIDDRIDEQMRKDPSGNYIWLHLDRKEPADGIVLKRFDPNRLTLSYLDRVLDVGKCFAEIQLVYTTTNRAHGKIREYQPLLDAMSISNEKE